VVPQKIYARGETLRVVFGHGLLDHNTRMGTAGRRPFSKRRVHTIVREDARARREELGDWRTLPFEAEQFDAAAGGISTVSTTVGVATTSWRGSGGWSSSPNRSLDFRFGRFRVV